MYAPVKSDGKNSATQTDCQCCGHHHHSFPGRNCLVTISGLQSSFTGVIRNLVKTFPNDMELGSRVREFVQKVDKGETVVDKNKKINSYFTTDIKDNENV